MPTLKKVAQIAEDLFHQSYATADTIWNEVRFKFLCVSAYNTLLVADFDRAKKEATKETGFSVVDLPGDFLVYKTVKIVKEAEGIIAKIPHVFSFDYDLGASGVQGVDIIGLGTEVVREQYRNRHSLDRLPYNGKTYCYVKTDKGQTILVFKTNQEIVGKEVEVGYFPQLSEDDDDCEVASDFVMPLVTQVLNLMFGAKNGQIIDMTANQNPNVTAATEIDSSSLKK
jgi:hypothetical protein